jgi:hypothetical protein
MNDNTNLRRCLSSISIVALIATFVTLTACSTVNIADNSQIIQVNAISSNHESITDAQCTLRNDRGSWSGKTPAPVRLIVSEAPLYIACNKEGYQSASVTLEAQTEGRVVGDLGRLGKLVIGGSNEAKPAFMTQGKVEAKTQYPSTVSVLLSPIADNKSTIPATSKPDGGTASSSGFDFFSAQQQCLDIGLIKGTENFGLCVLKLLK